MQSPNIVERRRTIRIRPEALKRERLDAIDRPAIKFAETREELEGVYELIYKQYRRAGYVRTPHASGLLYSIHAFLPETCVFAFKSHQTVIGTMSFIPDTDLFGLPMDSLYRVQLDSMREYGRRVGEISALASAPGNNGHQIVRVLARALFEYLHLTGFDDVVIQVNPRHVRFYRQMFLFQHMGPARFYERVGAPAVAMRLDFRKHGEKLRQVYPASDFDMPLAEFLCKTNHILPGSVRSGRERCVPMDYDAARRLFGQRPELLRKLSEEQWTYMATVHHKALFAGGAVAH